MLREGFTKEKSNGIAASYSPPIVWNVNKIKANICLRGGYVSVYYGNLW